MRLDKVHAKAAGMNKAARQYKRRYSHRLTDYITQRNLAQLANKQPHESR
jgi:hypothetical protein